ncbi:uncharacterized protein LOC131874786 [Cryptomeria japonica]|uniref:uncharacterized protein LOC131874786 n=1 Tax=Cryptomeria japonica TaxID=3369 RepID=UPI0027DA7ED3|nr:uncharacterized protein LOC131874786 [Cryptomeria japonica]
MGICFSCQVTHPTAKLILDDGGLKEFSEPVKVAEVLRERPDFFVSHSDSMDFDQYLIALSLENQLQVGHLYFLLPREKLQNPLPSSEMATMAVKAAAALQQKHKKNSRRMCRRSKIKPEVEHNMEGFNHLKESPSFRGTTVGDFRDLWKMKLSPVPEAFDY